MSRNPFTPIIALVLSAAAMAFAGCGSGSSGVNRAAEDEHIRKIPGFVNDYRTAMKKPPASLEEVRDWAVKEGKAKDEDFVSTRDKELYTIAFTGMGISVRETTGKDGKCYMLAMGGVSQVSAEDAKRMMGDQQLGPGSKGPMRK
jgi:hypothetical protein